MTKAYYLYYDKCTKCGSDYTANDKYTADTSPPLYPVVCINCGLETSSRLLLETKTAGWSSPDWEIDERIDEWHHESPSTDCPLWEFMGISYKDYKKWVMDNKYPIELDSVR